MSNFVNHSCTVIAAVLVVAAIAVAATVSRAQESPEPSTKPRDPIGPIRPPNEPPPFEKDKSGDKLVQVRIVPDAAMVSPGQTVRVAIVFDIEPRWHIYWKNSGTSGGPTEINVKTPPGFIVKDTLFPRPESFNDEDGVTYGYQGQTVLFVDITAPADLSPGAVMFSANINWLVCKDVCLMGKSFQTFSLVGRSSRSSDGDLVPVKTDPTVEKIRKRLPRPLNDQKGAGMTFDGKSVQIMLPRMGKTTATVFPIECPGVTLGEAVTKIDGDLMTVVIPVDINPINARGRTPVAAGLLALGTALDDPCFEFAFPLPGP